MFIGFQKQHPQNNFLLADKMGEGGFFRGTSSNQDARFLDKQKKLRAQMKFDACLDTKVRYILFL